MKIIQKYFLALVPPTEILEKAQEIKFRIRDEFGIKYALKSPPHITLKMPFNYNEAKEELLVAKLGDHLKGQQAFPVKISGLGNFGNRVVFLAIERSEQLIQIQQKLKLFCKQNLHLIDELSDRNFHPHLTIAFKDIKSNQFPEVLTFAKKQSFDAEFYAADLVLLKRKEGAWIIHRKVAFGG